MVCSACGYANQDGTKFCRKCGVDLRQIQGATIDCAQCGAEISADKQFCTRCGATLKSEMVLDPMAAEESTSSLPAKAERATGRFLWHRILSLIVATMSGLLVGQIMLWVYPLIEPVPPEASGVLSFGMAVLTFGTSVAISFAFSLLTNRAKRVRWNCFQVGPQV